MEPTKITYHKGTDWERSEWWLNGRRHRVDGPARILKGGSEEWFRHGKRHRKDGPAIEWNSGEKEWYLNGVRYSEEDYKRKLFKNNLRKLNGSHKRNCR